MEFRLLGPLEAENASGLVPLGGARQRATLAYLLLHANQVVPTRQLLTAVWGVDRVTGTTRKILQNVIWRLRRAIGTSAGEPDAPELLTRVPGYLVRVAPDQVDLVRFQRLTAEGRAALSADDPGRARVVLREALGLWRGPALADLAEEGTVWPEVAALEQRRLDVMEDCFDVELRCGEHQSVLRELDAYVMAEPLRERAAQQLMLALYRCGRPADALGVYARVRVALVEGLGLEPGRQMQQLQQSILAQSPDLDLSPPRRTAVTGPRTGEGPGPDPDEGVPAAAGAVHPDGGTRTTSGTGTLSGHGAASGTGAGERGERGGPAPRSRQAAAPAGEDRSDHRSHSVLLLHFGLGPEFDDLPPGDIDRVLDSVCQLAREEIVASGGVAATSIGSVLLGLFEATADRTDSAERAVRAGSVIQDCLSLPFGLLSPFAPAIQGLTVHAAVATGTDIECHWPESAGGSIQPWISGGLVDMCETILSRVEPGEVHVCEETRSGTEGEITYHRISASPPAWRVRTAGPAPDGDRQRYGRESELELMDGFLSRTRQHCTPHLITVLGPSDCGRTRLLMEFHRRVAEAGDPVCVLTGTVSDPDDVLSVPAGMLAAYCGITLQDAPDTAERKLTAALQDLPDADGAAAALPLLGRLVTRADGNERPVLAAWRRFMAMAARTRPMLLIWDSLHQADGALLETVEQLCADGADAPLLNVVGAHNNLLSHHPTWSCGLQHAMTLRLAPLPDDAMDRLLRSLSVPDSNTA